MRSRSFALILLTLTLLFGSSALVFADWHPREYAQTGHSKALKDKRLRAPIDFDLIDHSVLQAAIFYATNEARTAEGLDPLQHEPLLERAAQIHAQRMVALNFFSGENPHDPDLRTPEDRARQLGILNPILTESIATHIGIQARPGEPLHLIDPKTNYFSRTENGPPIPPHTYLSLARGLVKQWMNSPFHRANILSPEAVQLGCGAAFYFDQGFPRFKAVQLFQLDVAVEQIRPY